ncbi:MAG: imidazole glycerol phosphate synthase subunit HisH [Bacillota bacterium]
MIGILSYGIGNVGSIRNMLKKAGAVSVIVQTADELSACDKLILPGVGAFDTGMDLLNKSGMRHALDDAVQGGKPLLGICLGMQMLGEKSEEGKLAGLSYIPFHNVRFRLDPAQYKVPHMGWNYVTITDETDPLVKGLSEKQRYYFVHSYHAQCSDNRDALMLCDYGYSFTAAVRRGNVWGTQFHPEKSHRFGMALFKYFAEEC